MTHPLGKNLSFQQLELRFYVGSILCVCLGYGATALTAILFQKRAMYGPIDLVLNLLMVWLAMGIGAWLIHTFTEWRLQLMCSVFMQAVPVGILCGPLLKKVPAEFLLDGALAFGAFMVAACIIGLMLPVGSHRFFPFWLGQILLACVAWSLTPLSYGQTQGLSGIQAYGMVLLAAAMTTGDVNRGKSGWFLMLAGTSRIQALMWLDSTNLLYNLYRRCSRD
ncbi:MAG TPA: hypothetical protein VFO38_00470 [Candidatus Saccharimonadales bacterium]|nr:hypothetical protein [Candidatus Saccharimonadales bacterium]